MNEKQINQFHVVNDVDKNRRDGYNKKVKNTIDKPKVSFFRKFDFWRNIISLTFYIVYVLIRIFTAKGVAWVNWCLLGATCFYLAYFAIVFHFSNKKVEKAGKNSYKTAKRVLILINALMTAMAVWTTKDIGKASTFFVSIFTITNLAMQVLFEIIFTALNKKIKKVTANISDKAKSVKNRLFAKNKKSQNIDEQLSNEQLSDEQLLDEQSQDETAATEDKCLK